MKKITILGATGSIGQQTVDVCLHHQDEFEVVAVSALPHPANRPDVRVSATNIASVFFFIIISSFL